MKKLYLMMLTAVLALCSSFRAEAQTEEVSVTVKWDTPGAVVFKIANKVIDVPSDVTEYTFVRPKSEWPTLRIEGAAGHMLTNVSYVNGDKTGTVKINNQGYVSLSFSGTQFNGATVTVTTKELKKDGNITLNVENGASFLDQVYFPAGNGVALENVTLDKGNGTYTLPIYNGIQTSLYFKTKDNRSIYSLNGLTASKDDISFGYKNTNATLSNIKDGDVVTLRVFEGEEPVVKTCTVTLELAAGLENALERVYNRSASKIVPVEDNKFQVNSDSEIQLSFNEDYDITSINGGAIAYNEEYHTATFTVTDDMTVKVEGKAHVYNDITITAYLVNADGLDIWQGNSWNGVKAELGEGTLVNEDIVLPRVAYGDQVADEAYTIPAGTAYRYQFKVSEKYGEYGIYAKDGYYVAHARANGEEGMEAFRGDFTHSATTVYAVCKQIKADSQFKVLVVGNAENINLRSLTHYPELANGYNTLQFDPEYHNPYTVNLWSDEETNNNMLVQNDEALKSDEYGRFNFTAAHGDVIRIYNDGKAHAQRTVTFDLENAEVTRDRGIAVSDLSQPAKLWDGTEVCILPDDESMVITLDGEALEPNSLGEYVFTVSGNHTVAATAQAGPVFELIPSSEGPVTALDNIIISFPEAKKAEVKMPTDEIMLFNGNYGASGVTVEAVEGVDFPAYKITFTPAPTVSGMYMFYMPEGFFEVDGVASSEIQEYYNLTVASELTWNFNPFTKIIAGEYKDFSVLFDENHRIVSADISAISVSFNGTKMAAGEYELGTEGSYLLGVITAEKYFNQTGTLTIDIPEGAIRFADTQCPAISHTWEVVENKTFEMVITPDNAAHTGELAELTISFPTAAEAKVVNETGIFLSNKSYSFSCTGTITPVEGAAYPTFKVTFDKEFPADESGVDYSLRITAGTFLIEEVYENDYYTKTYSGMSGIEDIIVDGPAANGVYNLQGVRLTTPWNELPAGLYIRDGRKVLKH